MGQASNSILFRFEKSNGRHVQIALQVSDRPASLEFVFKQLAESEIDRLFLPTTEDEWLLQVTMSSKETFVFADDDDRATSTINELSYRRLGQFAQLRVLGKKADPAVIFAGEYEPDEKRRTYQDAPWSQLRLDGRSDQPIFKEKA